MPTIYTIEGASEAFIRDQLANGRYDNPSDVVDAALKQMEQRERVLLLIDATVMRGIANSDAGQVHDAERLFAELEARYTKASAERPET